MVPYKSISIEKTICIKISKKNKPHIRETGLGSLGDVILLRLSRQVTLVNGSSLIALQIE
jgi:hypothetical protein